ncbi:MAG: multiheme c-type cytochrome [Bacteroidetes bacterium]|nr:multiheme c-type cytochrome [Bacteroidota bacterium]
MPQQVTRLLIVFAVFIGMFLVAAAFLKPASFGEYGHYRGNAIKEIAAKEIKFVDRKSCANCHNDNSDALAGAEHALINCQTCHGPGYKHNQWFEQNKSRFMRQDPASGIWTVDTILVRAAKDIPEEYKLLKPNERDACLKCHAINAARREKVVRQIDVTDHYDVKKKCVECHPPHAPNS